MAFCIGITAIVVGIIAYGMGKLSVYVLLDNERDPALPQDSSEAWDAQQFELWSKAQDNMIASERELAKLVATLSLAGVAGVVALAEVKIINTLGVAVLMAGFFLAAICCIANLQLRQSWFGRRARQMQEAFDQGNPLCRVSYRARTAVLPLCGAVLLGAALVLTLMTLAANTCTTKHANHCVTEHANNRAVDHPNRDKEPWYCNEFLKGLLYKS